MVCRRPQTSLAKVFRLRLSAIAERLMSVFVNPAVCFEPAKRSDDALLDRELGFPAGGLDFFRIKEDEWVVADPAFVATSVFDLWGHSQGCADVADALVDLHVLGRSEIVDLRVVFGVTRGVFTRDVEDGVDAILDVKIAFALGAIAEDTEVAGVL